jgi:hypothetical protein
MTITTTATIAKMMRLRGPERVSSATLAGPFAFCPATVL